MQPYFFPYLGHFALIASCDHWVVFDVSQYTHRTWISRNRVLHPQQGWNYVNVPLSNGSTSIRIADARIADFKGTRDSVLGRLSHYRRAAPYYREVIALVERVLQEPCEYLVDLDMRSLAQVCSYLGIAWNAQRASSLELDESAIETPGQWAPRISQSLGASAYLNPLGGAAIFRREDFHAAGVRPEFLAFEAPIYDTGRYAFESNLSILDVLMWNDPVQVRAMIDQNATVLDGHAILN
jgi:hypothetical protein